MKSRSETCSALAGSDGKRRITADTALRLARYFGTTDRFRLNLQARYDLETQRNHLGTAIPQIHPLQSA